MTTRHRYAVLVVGGGVMGLATLEALTRRTRAPVGLLEQHTLAHSRGSSHGAVRIARSAYADAVYARLMQRAYAEDWPRLAADAGETLLLGSPGCFFGAGAAIDTYRDAVRAAGLGDDAVEELAVDEARRRYPSMRFPNAAYVLDDHTCHVVAADRTTAVLARLARKRGAAIHEGHALLELDLAGRGVRVVSGDVEIDCDAVVVTAGPWVRRLVPKLARPLTALRQTVAFFRPSADPAAFRLGRFPLWCEVGHDDAMHYALPELDAGLLKIARHRLTGPDDDPDADAAPDPAEVERLREVASRVMTVAVGAAERADTCLYTCTPTEDFVIGALPGERRVVIGAGFSGHGFKFAPLVGRVLADLALDGRSSVPEFEAERARFAAG